MAHAAAQRRDFAHLGKEQVRCGHADEAHQGTTSRLATLLRQRPAHRQTRSLLRVGDNTREDTALLRQGDTLLRGSVGAVVQGRRQTHQHPRRNLRGARLAKGHHHRTPRRGSEEDVYRGTQVA